MLLKLKQSGNNFSQLRMLANLLLSLYLVACGQAHSPERLGFPESVPGVPGVCLLICGINQIGYPNQSSLYQTKPFPLIHL